MKQHSVTQRRLWFAATALLVVVLWQSRDAFVEAGRGLPAWGGDEAYVTAYTRDLDTHRTRGTATQGLANVYPRGLILPGAVVYLYLAPGGLTPDDIDAVHTARMLQGQLAVVTALLLMLVGLAVGGPRWALGLLALGVLYPPLAAGVQTVSREYPAALLVTLGLLSCALSHRRGAWLLAVGLIFLGASTLAQPALLYLGPVVGGYLAWRWLRRAGDRQGWFGPQARSSRVGLGLGALILVVLALLPPLADMRIRQGIQRNYGAEPLVVGPALGTPVWAYLDSDGLPSDTNQPDQAYAQALRERMARLKQGHVREVDHLALGALRVVAQPLDVARVLLNGLDRAVRRCPNLFGQAWGLTFPQQQALHLALMGLAVAGMLTRLSTPALRTTRGVAVCMALYGVVVFGGAVHDPHAMLALASPMLLLVGCGMYGAWRAIDQAWQGRREALHPWLLGALVWVVWALPARLLPPALVGTASVLLWLQVALLALTALAALALAARRASPAGVVAALVLAVLVGVGYPVRVATNVDALRWEMPLDQHNRAAMQWIELSPHDLERADRAIVWMDCRAPQEYRWLTVDVNQARVKQAHQPAPLTLTRAFYGHVLDRAWNRDHPRPRWVGVPVPLPVARRDTPMEITVRQTHNAPREVALAGDYPRPGRDAKATFVGPSLTTAAHDRSRARLLHTLEDYRLPGRTPLQGVEIAAARLADHGWDGARLAPGVGRRHGRYRILTGLGRLNSLEWETPIVRQATPTIFWLPVVAGSTPGEARLTLNGQPLIDFATGLDESRVWRRDDVTLDYEARARVGDTQGGVYSLVLSATRLQVPGPQRLSLTLIDGFGGGYLHQDRTWICVVGQAGVHHAIWQRTELLLQGRLARAYGEHDLLRGMAAHGEAEQREVRSFLGVANGPYLSYGCQWIYH